MSWMAGSQTDKDYQASNAERLKTDGAREAAALAAMKKPPVAAPTAFQNRVVSPVLTGTAQRVGDDQIGPGGGGPGLPIPPPGGPGGPGGAMGPGLPIPPPGGPGGSAPSAPAGYGVGGPGGLAGGPAGPGVAVPDQPDPNVMKALQGAARRAY